MAEMERIHTNPQQGVLCAQRLDTEQLSQSPITRILRHHSISFPSMELMGCTEGQAC